MLLSRRNATKGHCTVRGKTKDRNNIEKSSDGLNAKQKNCVKQCRRWPLGTDSYIDTTSS